MDSFSLPLMTYTTWPLHVPWPVINSIQVGARRLIHIMKLADSEKVTHEPSKLLVGCVLKTFFHQHFLYVILFIHQIAHVILFFLNST